MDVSACPQHTQNVKVSADVRNSTEANLQVKCGNQQLRNRTEICKEIQNKIIKSNTHPV